MWNLITGKSSEKSEAPPSESRRRKDYDQRSTQQPSESIVSSNSARKPSRGDDRDGDRGFNPTSTSYSSTSRSSYPGTASASIASSYATASNGQADDPILPPGLVRNPSLANQTPKSRPSRDDRDQDRARERKSERRRSSSRDRKRDRDSKRRERKGQRNKVDRGDGKDRGLTRSGSGYAEEPSTPRAGEISAQAGGSFNAQVGSSGFTQFPGQYDGGIPGFTSGPPPLHESMSAHVQDQFPGQFPLESTAPYRPPLAASEGGPGLAADYYGDAGESVAEQPGVRPHPLRPVIGAEPHLQPATHIAAPPPEPSSAGGIGAAASFYSGVDFPSTLPSQASTTSKPPRPGKPSKPTSSGSFSGSAALAGSAVLGYTTGAAGEAFHTQGSGFNGPAYYQQGSGRPPPSAEGMAEYSSTSAPINNGYHASSAPVLPTLGAAAAGATAGAAAGYMMGSYSSEQQQPSVISGHGGYSSSATQRPPQFGDPAIGTSANPRPLRPAKYSSQSSTLSLHVAGQSIPMAQKHRHRTGPLGTFVEFWTDPDGVAQYEEYTEYIGVCRNCFAPGSTPRDAPRKHHYRRRRSDDRYGSSSRVDKESRWGSSDGENRRRSRKSWLAGGIAGYGLAEVGKTLFNQRRGTDDTYNVRFSRGNASNTSLRRRSGSHSPGRGSRTSYGVTGGSSTSISRRRSRSRERIETGITSDGRIYKKDPHGSLLGGPAMKTYTPRRRSRSRSRSRSRDRHDGLAAAALGAAIGSSVVASKSRRRSRSTEKVFVRSKHRSRERSSDRGEVSMLGGFFSSPSEKRQRTHRKKKKGFFSFGNLSSSSADADLAFGAGLEVSRSRKQRSPRSRNGRSADAAFLGLSAAAAAIALRESQKGSKSSRKADLVAVKETKSKKSVASERQHRGKRTSASPTMEDDLWESASEEDDSSSANSALAYGVRAQRSQESLTSDSSGTGKWGWRWGSKKRSKRTAPADPTTSSFHINAGTAAATLAGATAGVAGISNSWEADSRMSSSSNLPPLQQVYPVPTSDPSRFDVTRHDSIASTYQPLMTSRPAPVPLQQPQPIAPVSHTVYTTQPPYTHSYSAPSGPPVFSKNPYQAQPSIVGGPRDTPNGLRQTNVPGSFPGGDVVVDNTSWNGRAESSRRRRETSPITRTAEPEVDPLPRRRRAPTRDESSAVRFDFSEEFKGEERYDSRRQEIGLDQRREETKVQDADKQRKFYHERRSSNEVSVRKSESISEPEGKIDQKGESQWYRRDDDSKKRKPGSRVVPVVATTVGAAIGASAAEAAHFRAETYQEEHREDERRNRIKNGEGPANDEPKYSSEKGTRTPDHAEQTVKIAPRVLSKSVKNPNHENYADYFLPSELLSQSKDDRRSTDVNSGNDVTTNEVDLDHTSLSWEVPRLNLIEPTPPHSIAGSTKGNASPVIKPEDAGSEETEVKIAPQVLSKSVKNPNHENYADYFVPSELLSQSKDDRRSTDVNSGNDVTSHQISQIITVEPRGSGLSFLPLHAHTDEVDPDHTSLSWEVPRLNLIEPTPPHSIAGSTKGNTSPVVKPEDAGIEETEEIPGSSTTSKVTWGKDETHTYQVVTPLENPEEFIGTSIKQRNEEEDTHSSGEASPLDATPIIVERVPRHMPGDFGDDLEFAATVAAGLEDTGFDPAIVIDDATFRRRDSPPGSEPTGFYRRPFAETIIDLGLDSLGTEGAPPQRGFVEGELPSTPKYEQGPSANGGNADGSASNPSRKDRKSRKKVAQRESGDDAPVAVSRASELHDRGGLFDEPGRYSTEPQAMVSVPVNVFDYLDKGARVEDVKGKDSKRDGGELDSASSGSPVPADLARTEYFDAPEAAAEVPKPPSISREFDDVTIDIPSAEQPVDEFQDPRRADKRKKKLKKSGQEGQIFDIAVESSESPTSERNGEVGSKRKSDRQSSRRDSEHYDLADRESRSVMSGPVSKEYAEEGKSRSRKNRDKIDLYDSPPKDTHSTLASAPIEDEFDESRKSKKKSKRGSSGYDASVSSSATFEDKREPKSKSKKNKKGGLLGLFGASKSSDKLSDTAQAQDAIADTTSEIFEEPRRKHKKSKERRSTRDGDDVSNQASNKLLEHGPEPALAGEVEVEGNPNDFEDANGKRKQSKGRKADRAHDGGDGYGEAYQSTSNLSRLEGDDDDGKSRRKEHKRRSRESDFMEESGRVSQALQAKVYKAASPGRFLTLVLDQVLMSPEDRDLPSTRDAPIMDAPDVVHAKGNSGEDKPDSFLEERQKSPLPPDIYIPADPHDLHAEKSVENSPPSIVQPETEANQIAGTDGFPSTSPLAMFPLEDLPPLPASRPASPVLEVEDHRRRTSFVQASESPQSPVINSSPTAIPLHFRRPPASPGPARSSPFVSPASPSQSALVFVPPQRRSRPNSTEFKSSTEFRPLWLVERHGSRQEPAPVESYPSLPSSHTTSRSSSVHDPEEADSHLYRDDGLSESDGEDIGLRIDVSRSFERPDLLGSRQTTPTAASFHLDTKENVLAEAMPDSAPAEMSASREDSAEEATRGISLSSPEKFSHSVGDHLQECYVLSPLYLEGLKDLPPLPASRSSSPLLEDHSQETSLIPEEAKKIKGLPSLLTSSFSSPLHESYGRETSLISEKAEKLEELPPLPASRLSSPLYEGQRQAVSSVPEEVEQLEDLPPLPVTRSLSHLHEDQRREISSMSEEAGQLEDLPPLPASNISSPLPKSQGPETSSISEDAGQTEVLPPLLMSRSSSSLHQDQRQEIAPVSEETEQHEELPPLPASSISSPLPKSQGPETSSISEDAGQTEVLPPLLMSRSSSSLHQDQRQEIAPVSEETEQHEELPPLPASRSSFLPREHEKLGTSSLQDGAAMGAIVGLAAATVALASINNDKATARDSFPETEANPASLMEETTGLEKGEPQIYIPPQDPDQSEMLLTRKSKKKDSKNRKAGSSRSKGDLPVHDQGVAQSTNDQDVGGLIIDEKPDVQEVDGQEGADARFIPSTSKKSKKDRKGKKKCRGGESSNTPVDSLASSNFEASSVEQSRAVSPSGASNMADSPAPPGPDITTPSQTAEVAQDDWQGFVTGSKKSKGKKGKKKLAGSWQEESLESGADGPDAALDSPPKTLESKGPTPDDGEENSQKPPLSDADVGLADVVGQSTNEVAPELVSDAKESEPLVAINREGEKINEFHVLEDKPVLERSPSSPQRLDITGQELQSPSEKLDSVKDFSETTNAVSTPRAAPDEEFFTPIGIPQSTKETEAEAEFPFPIGKGQASKKAKKKRKTLPLVDYAEPSNPPLEPEESSATKGMSEEIQAEETDRSIGLTTITPNNTFEPAVELVGDTVRSSDGGHHPKAASPKSQGPSAFSQSAEATPLPMDDDLDLIMAPPANLTDRILSPEAVPLPVDKDFDLIETPQAKLADRSLTPEVKLLPRDDDRHLTEAPQASPAENLLAPEAVSLPTDEDRELIEAPSAAKRTLAPEVLPSPRDSYLDLTEAPQATTAEKLLAPEAVPLPSDDGLELIEASSAAERSLTPEVVSLPRDSDLDLTEAPQARSAGHSLILDALPLPTDEDLGLTEEPRASSARQLLTPEAVPLTTDNDLDLTEAPRASLADQSLTSETVPLHMDEDLSFLSPAVGSPDKLSTPEVIQLPAEEDPNLIQSSSASLTDQSLNPEAVPLHMDEDLSLIRASSGSANKLLTPEAIPLPTDEDLSLIEASPASSADSSLASEAVPLPLAEEHNLVKAPPENSAAQLLGHEMIPLPIDEDLDLVQAPPERSAERLLSPKTIPLPIDEELDLVQAPSESSAERLLSPETIPLPMDEDLDPMEAPSISSADRFLNREATPLPTDATDEDLNLVKAPPERSAERTLGPEAVSLPIGEDLDLLEALPASPILQPSNITSRESGTASEYGSRLNTEKDRELTLLPLTLADEPDELISDRAPGITAVEKKDDVPISESPSATTDTGKAVRDMLADRGSTPDREAFSQKTGVVNPLLRNPGPEQMILENPSNFEDHLTSDSTYKERTIEREEASVPSPVASVPDNLLASEEKLASTSTAREVQRMLTDRGSLPPSDDPSREDMAPLTTQPLTKPPHEDNDTWDIPVKKKSKKGKKGRPLQGPGSTADESSIPPTPTVEPETTSSNVDAMVGAAENFTLKKSKKEKKGMKGRPLEDPESTTDGTSIPPTPTVEPETAPSNEDAMVGAAESFTLKKSKKEKKGKKKALRQDSSSFLDEGEAEVAVMSETDKGPGKENTDEQSYVNQAIRPTEVQELPLSPERQSELQYATSVPLPLNEVGDKPTDVVAVERVQESEVAWSRAVGITESKTAPGVSSHDQQLSKSSADTQLITNQSRELSILGTADPTAIETAPVIETTKDSAIEDDFTTFSTQKKGKKAKRQQKKQLEQERADTAEGEPLPTSTQPKVLANEEEIGSSFPGDKTASGGRFSPEMGAASRDALRELELEDGVSYFGLTSVETAKDDKKQGEYYRTTIAGEGDRAAVHNYHSINDEVEHNFSTAPHDSTLATIVEQPDDVDPAALGHEPHSQLADHGLPRQENSPQLLESTSKEIGRDIGVTELGTGSLSVEQSGSFRPHIDDAPIREEIPLLATTDFAIVHPSDDSLPIGDQASGSAPKSVAGENVSLPSNENFSTFVTSRKSKKGKKSKKKQEPVSWEDETSPPAAVDSGEPTVDNFEAPPSLPTFEIPEHGTSRNDTGYLPAEQREYGPSIEATSSIPRNFPAPEDQAPVDEVDGEWGYSTKKTKKKGKKMKQQAALAQDIEEQPQLEETGERDVLASQDTQFWGEQREPDKFDVSQEPQEPQESQHSDITMLAQHVDPDLITKYGEHASVPFIEPYQQTYSTSQDNLPGGVQQKSMPIADDEATIDRQTEHEHAAANYDHPQEVTATEEEKQDDLLDFPTKKSKKSKKQSLTLDMDTQPQDVQPEPGVDQLHQYASTMSNDLPLSTGKPEESRSVSPPQVTGHYGDGQFAGAAALAAIGAGAASALWHKTSEEKVDKFKDPRDDRQRIAHEDERVEFPSLHHKAAQPSEGFLQLDNAIQHSVPAQSQLYHDSRPSVPQFPPGDEHRQNIARPPSVPQFPLEDEYRQNIAHPSVPSFHYVDDVKRDSAVQISDSPVIPERLPTYDVVRDSGYQGTESSPLIGTDPEFVDTNWAEHHPGIVERPSTQARHKEVETPEQDRSYKNTAFHNADNALNISIEVDPSYEVAISRLQSRRGRGKVRSNTQDGSLDKNVPPRTDLRRASDVKSLVQFFDKPLQPSAVESATKDRSSVLFQSSPSIREERTTQPEGHETLHTPRGNIDHTDTSPATNNSRENPLEPEVSPRVVAHDGASILAARASSLAALSGLIDAHQGSPRSLFGGPVGINSDLPSTISPPRTPFSLENSGRRQLNTITEHSPEESPHHKKARAISDIGSPERGTKSVRRSATPGEITQQKVRSPTIASAKDKSLISTDDVLARLSWPAVDEDKHSVDLERSRSRNTDRRASSRHSNVSALVSDAVRPRETEHRSLSGASIRSGDSINAIIRTPEQFHSASGLSNRSGTPPLRRVDTRSVSGDLRAASKRGEAKDLAKPAEGEAEPEAAPALSLAIPSSSTYDPVKDKGKSRAKDMADVYVSYPNYLYRDSDHFEG